MLSERAATYQAAEADLNEMNELLKNSSWTEARAALERAKGRLGERPPVRLIQRLERGRLNLELVDRLDAIRLEGFVMREDSLDFKPSDIAYENAFRQAGLVVPGKSIPTSQLRKLVLPQ